MYLSNSSNLIKGNQHHTHCAEVASLKLVKDVRSLNVAVYESLRMKLLRNCSDSFKYLITVPNGC